MDPLSYSSAIMGRAPPSGATPSLGSRAIARQSRPRDRATTASRPMRVTPAPAIPAAPLTDRSRAVRHRERIATARQRRCCHGRRPGPSVIFGVDPHPRSPALRRRQLPHARSSRAFQRRRHLIVIPALWFGTLGASLSSTGLGARSPLFGDADLLHFSPPM